MDDLTVRLMFHRDLRAVLAIEQKKPAPQWTADDFRPIFQFPDTDGWVAEVDEGIVGHIVFKKVGQGTTLLNLVAAPSWRRQGIARVLLDKMFEKRTGPVLVVVPEANLPAQLFFRSAGFKAVQVLRRHFDGQDGYLMVRALVS